MPLQQDLASMVCSASAWTASPQLHPDLHQCGRTSLHLRIVDGQIANRSLAAIGYASGTLPGFHAMR